MNPLAVRPPQDVVSPEEDLRAQLCPCGTVHIHIGPMSLRFSARSFERLAGFIADIQKKRLEQRAHPLPSPSPFVN